MKLQIENRIQAAVYAVRAGSSRRGYAAARAASTRCCSSAGRLRRLARSVVRAARKTLSEVAGRLVGLLRSVEAVSKYPIRRSSRRRSPSSSEGSRVSVGQRMLHRSGGEASWGSGSALLSEGVADALGERGRVVAHQHL